MTRVMDSCFCSTLKGRFPSFEGVNSTQCLQRFRNIPFAPSIVHQINSDLKPNERKTPFYYKRNDKRLKSSFFQTFLGKYAKSTMETCSVHTRTPWGHSATENHPTSPSPKGKKVVSNHRLRLVQLFISNL